MSSIKILKFVLDKLKQAKHTIVNLDMTITCENIFFGNRKDRIKNSLVKLLKTKFINVKATRYERPSKLINCETIILIKGDK